MPVPAVAGTTVLAAGDDHATEIKANRRLIDPAVPTMGGLPPRGRPSRVGDSTVDETESPFQKCRRLVRSMREVVVWDVGGPGDG